jgi:hypothetical protein
VVVWPHALAAEVQDEPLVKQPRPPVPTAKAGAGKTVANPRIAVAVAYKSVLGRFIEEIFFIVAD